MTTTIQDRRRTPAAWRGVRINVGSVRSGLECNGIVEGAVAGLLVVVLEPDPHLTDDYFHAGDNLRIGWPEDGRWLHATALCARVEDRHRIVITAPDGTTQPELRREHARAEIFAGCEVVVPRPGRATVIKGRVFDLSAGGMAARLSVQLPYGTAVLVSIELPNGRFAAVAKVVRDDRITRFAFVQTRPQDRALIAAALAQRVA